MFRDGIKRKEKPKQAIDEYIFFAIFKNVTINKLSLCTLFIIPF